MMISLSCLSSSAREFIGFLKTNIDNENQYTEYKNTENGEKIINML